MACAAVPLTGAGLAVAWRTQLWLLLSAAGEGIRLALVYELFRVPRRFLRLGRAFTALTDFVYCLIAALMLFGFFLRVSQGRPRLYLLAGMAGGAALWFRFPGQLLMRLTESTRRTILRALCFFGLSAGKDAKKIHFFAKK